VPKLRKADKKTKIKSYLAQLSVLYVSLVISITTVIYFSIIFLKKDPELPLFVYFLVTIISVTLWVVPFFIAFKFATMILRLISARDNFLMLIITSIIFALSSTSSVLVDPLNLIRFVPNALLYDPFGIIVDVLITTFYFFLTVLAFGFVYRTIKSWWRK
jgi:hypothetical protein